MRIAIFEAEPWEEASLKKQLKGHQLHFYPEPLQEKHLPALKNAQVLSIFIYSKVTGAMLKKLPHLKFIATRSTGFDHIDLKACKRKGIIVSNVPNYGENTVAEHTFALILNLSRNVHKSYIRTLRSDFSIQGLQGFDLKGKTLGVIGGGKIGMHVVRIAKGFGMNVVVYDVHEQPFLSEVLGFSYAPLKELLGQSDILTLHAPLLPSTKHIINKESVKWIKKGAVLVNTSRGELVDNEALLYALQKKILSGAGLDVIEGEKLIKEESHLRKEQDRRARDLGNLVSDHILIGMDNVVYTPHIAFYSKEALQRILDTTVQNIEAYVSGEPEFVVK